MSRDPERDGQREGYLPPYRLCVGIMLLNGDNQVFVGHRSNRRVPDHITAGHEWQMPQGGIDEGEKPYDAAVRELHEETNIRSISLIGEAPDWFQYDLPRDVLQKAWRGRYRGQSQKWFAFRFEGHESEINVRNPGPGFKPEFDAWRWEAIDRLPALIIPFKRPVYEKVVAYFGPLIERSKT